MHVFIFGPPGSGKSTQGAILSEKLGIPHLSVGDLLRELALEPSPQGRAMADSLQKGEMIADSIILKLLREKLSPTLIRNGFILDGFPRTEAQVGLLEILVEELGLKDYRPVDILVPAEESEKRLRARGRKDDTPEVIQKRLQDYQKRVGPILDYFRDEGNLVVVDGQGRIEEVASRLYEAVRPSGRPCP